MTPRRSRAIRLLASDPLPPLPTAADLLDSENPRRPGETHEALPLSRSAAERISAEAARLGIGTDLAASLLIEAGLLLDDVGPKALSLSGENGWPDSALSESSARYVRALTIARRPRKGARPSPGCAAIPVRLITRLRGESVDELIAKVELERAVSWEVAAMLEGRTMAEWVLLRLGR